MGFLDFIPHMNRPHSQAPSAIRMDIKIEINKGLANKKTGTKNASNTTAVITRVLSIFNDGFF